MPVPEPVKELVDQTVVVDTDTHLTYIGKLTSGIPVIVPTQLSNAVGGNSISTEHTSTIVGKDEISAKGSRVSLIMMFCACVSTLPLPSS